MQRHFSLVRSVRHAVRAYSSSTSDILLKERVMDGQVVRLTMNDVKRRNALSKAMLESLKGELEREGEDESVRAIVIAANGPAFSSGHNLKELTSECGDEAHRAVFSLCAQVMKLIQDVPVPVIGEVRGVAAAAGCQLAATCDIVVAAHSATFSTPGAKAGLFCSTPGIALGRAVPNKLAMDMLLTARTIDAQTALAGGLVSRVVEEAELDKEVETVAADICALSRPVIALGKSFFYIQLTQDRNSAYKIGETIMTENLRFEDGQEGIQSFIQKRRPLWKHSNDPVH